MAIQREEKLTARKVKITPGGKEPFICFLVTKVIDSLKTRKTIAGGNGAMIEIIAFNEYFVCPLLEEEVTKYKGLTSPVKAKKEVLAAQAAAAEKEAAAKKKKEVSRKGDTSPPSPSTPPFRGSTGSQESEANRQEDPLKTEPSKAEAPAAKTVEDPKPAEAPVAETPPAVKAEPEKPAPAQTPAPATERSPTPNDRVSMPRGTFMTVLVVLLLIAGGCFGFVVRGCDNQPATTPPVTTTVPPGTTTPTTAPPTTTVPPTTLPPTTTVPSQVLINQIKAQIEAKVASIFNPQIPWQTIVNEINAMGISGVKAEPAYVPGRQTPDIKVTIHDQVFILRGVTLVK